MPRVSAAAVRLDRFRRLVGVYVLVWLAVRWPSVSGANEPHESAFAPIGVVALLRDRPVPRSVSVTVVVACAVAALATIGGRHLRLALPALAATILWLGTYRSSWGQVFHTDNVLLLQVAVLAVAAVAFDARPEEDGSARVLHALAVVTAVVYVLAGMAKLRATGLDWITGDHLRNWVAYDNLRKIQLGDAHSPIGGWLVARSRLWPPIAVATLVIELGAPVVLLGRRWAAAWSALAWLFHLGVLASMAILFPYALTGIQFAPFLPLERLGSRRPVGVLEPT